jgi:hypothetical protein
MEVKEDLVFAIHYPHSMYVNANCTVGWRDHSQQLT